MELRCSYLSSPKSGPLISSNVQILITEAQRLLIAEIMDKSAGVTVNG